jgi:hypothetical protein
LRQPDKIGHSSEGTFLTWFPALAVDHIFVNAALQPLSLTAHRSPAAPVASVHFPLVAELVPACRRSSSPILATGAKPTDESVALPRSSSAPL